MDVASEGIQLDNLGTRARSAIRWRFLAQGSSTGVQMVTSIILARLLMPEDFGILALAVMVTGLAGIFRDLGLGQALVQRKELKPIHINSAFWGTLLMGVMLCGVIIAIAPYVGTFFKEPRMTPVLQIISLTFLISPFGVVPRSLLQRQLDFKRPFFAGIIGSLTHASVGITMALIGYSYWSLVAASLASSVVGTTAICVLTRYLPPVVPSLRGVKDLYYFGVGVTGVGLLNYIAQKADYFVVGRWLNSAALGLYSRAFNLVHFPLSAVSGTLYPVLFPAFSHIQDDPPRARAAFSRVITAIATLTFPALALFAVTAPELIPLVFGNQWIGAVVPAQIMAFAGMVRTIANPGGALIKAFGRVYGEVWRQAVYAAVLTVAALVGTRWGIIGVSWGALVATIIACLLGAQLVYSCSAFGPRDYGRALRGPLLSSVSVLLVAAAARVVMMRLGQDAWFTLAATTLVGILVGIVSTVYNPYQDWRTSVHGVLPKVGKKVSPRDTR